MTVTLTPEIETRLRTYAEDLDLDPQQLCADLLTRAFEEAEAELKETMDGLDRSAEDFAAGRWLTSEEFDQRMEAVIAAARARRDGLPSEEAPRPVAARVLVSARTQHLADFVHHHEAEGGDQAYVKLHQLRNAAQKPLTRWPDEE